MYPYILIFLLLCLIKNDKKSNLICFLLILLFMGSRYEVGKDWGLYYPIATKMEFSKYPLFRGYFEKIPFGDYYLYRYLTFEISNRILYKIVWLLKWPQLIIYLYSFLCLIFIKLGLENIEQKYIKYSWILFFSFPEFFLLNTNLMRQAVAISIIFFSYKFILNKKKIKFLLCILLAVSFHTSSIFFICAYLVNYIKRINKKIIFYIYIVCFFGKDILLLILNNSKIIPKKYIYYLSTTFLGGIKTNYLLYILGLLFIIFIVKAKENRKIILIILIGFYLNLLFKDTGYLVIRTRVYFLVFVLYLTPLLLKRYKISKLIFIIFCFISLVLSLYNDTISKYGGQYVPYKIFIQENNNGKE